MKEDIVDLRIVWDTAVCDVPVLYQQISEILREECPSLISKESNVRLGAEVSRFPDAVTPAVRFRERLMLTVAGMRGERDTFFRR